MKNAAALLSIVCMLALASVGEFAEAPRIVLLANSVDYELAADFIEFLQSKGVNVTRSTAPDFEQYKSEKFVAVLGGPNAYEGVGNMVQGILSSEEQEYLRVKGNRKMYVKTNVWAQGQSVFVIAGSDREQTKQAHIENRDALHQTASAPTTTQPPTIAPSPGETFTVQAGQVTNYPFSYWGFEKKGSYTTVRLRSGEPSSQTATYTFETLPATIQIDKHFYNITYYDNTEIVVQKIL